MKKMTKTKYNKLTFTFITIPQKVLSQINQYFRDKIVETKI